MSNKEPLIFNEINFQDILFDKIKITNKKKIIYLKYKNNNKLENLVIQTPTLWSTKTPVKIGENLYDLEIPLIGKREDHVDSFIQFLNNLDHFIINSAKNNAASWFNNSSNAVYLNSIRESNENSISNGFIKLKIIKSIDFKTILKKDNKHKIKVQNIKANCWVKSIIQIFAIWIKPNNHFGIYFRPIIVSFKNPTISNINYDFIKDTEDSINSKSEIIDNSIIDNSVFLKPSDIIKTPNCNITSILKIDISSFNKSDSDSDSDLKRIKILNFTV